MMKKLISLVLALGLLCAMIPALAEDDVTGDWYALMAGVPLQMTLNADGTFAMQMNGEAYPAESATWTMEGGELTLTMNGDTQKGTLADGKLSMTMGETALEFSRDPIEPITLAEVNPEAGEEDFEGHWVLKYVDMNGLVVDASAAGQALPELVVEKDQMTFAGESSMNDLFGTDPLALTYENGTMVYTLSVGDTLNISVTLSMLQDGIMGFALSMNDEATSMYFEKVIPEETPAT